MNVASMTVAGVAVRVRMTGMSVVMFMDVVGHRPYSTRGTAVAQPFRALIRQYDTSPPRFD